MQPLQFLDVDAKSEPPDRACIVHHRTDQLNVKRCTISDGQDTHPVKEGPSTPNFLATFLPIWLACADQVSRVSQGHPKIPHCLDTLYWLTEKLDWPLDYAVESLVVRAQRQLDVAESVGMSFMHMLTSKGETRWTLTISIGLSGPYISARGAFIWER
jgi:hypothetical protein